MVTQMEALLDPPGPSLLPPWMELSDARRRMFETAIVLFGERGFHGVSVRDLTEALGQHKAALYGHAASKQDLLFQLVLSGYQEHRQLLRDALAGADEDPVSQVRALVRAHVQFHLYYRAAARVCTRELRALTDENRETVTAVRDQTQRMLLDVIERGKREGVFTVDDVELAALAIAGMGIRIAEWQNAPAREPDQVASTSEDFALPILGANQG